MKRSSSRDDVKIVTIIERPIDLESKSITHRQAASEIGQLAAPFIVINLIQIGASYFNIYIVSSLNEESLGGLAVLMAAAGMLTNTMNALIYPVNILAGNKYGKLKKLMQERKQDIDNIQELEIKLKRYKRNIGSIVQQGWLLDTIAGGIGGVIIWNIRPLLQLFKQPDSIISIAESIAKPYAISFPMILWLRTNVDLLSSIGKQNILPIYNLALSFLSFGSGYIFVNGGFGIAAFGASGYGYANLFQQSIGLLIFLIYFLAVKDMHDYQLFIPRLKKSIHHLKALLKLGIPLFCLQAVNGGIGFRINMWYGELGLSRILIEQAAIQPLTYFFGVTAGISSACSRLIGRSYGLQQKKRLLEQTTSTKCCFQDYFPDEKRQLIAINDCKNIQTYGKTGLAVVGSLAIVPVFLYTTIPDQFAKVYLSHNDVRKYEILIRVSFLLNALTIGVSQVQDIAANALNNIHNTQYPACVGLTTSLLFTLPLTYMAGSILKWDIIGIDSFIFCGALINMSVILKQWFKQSSQLAAHKIANTQSSPNLNQQNSSGFSRIYNSCINQMSLWWSRKRSLSSSDQILLTTEIDEDEFKNNVFKNSSDDNGHRPTIY